jgi:hypothetical protein
MPKASDSAAPDVVGRFDFLHVERRVAPSRTRPFVFLGTIKESFLFAAAVCWMFTFTSSRISHRLEAGLGVGDR